VVFTGDGSRIKKYFLGRVLDYSDSESFLLDNAYVTAQCAIKLTFEHTDFSLRGKRALVLGYGRIGKYLASMLKSLGAVVFVFARREEARNDARKDGFIPCELSELNGCAPDLVYNTVPHKIVDKETSDKLLKRALIMDLASSPGGFFDEEVAMKASALPGKLMPESAGKAIFNYVSSVLSQLRRENDI